MSQTATQIDCQSRVLGEEFSALLQRIDELVGETSTEDTRHHGGGRKSFHFSAEYPAMWEDIRARIVPFYPPPLKHIRL